MYNKPIVLGIDSESQIGNQFALSELMNAYGFNTGNILFSEGLYRTVKNAKRCGYHFDETDLCEADCIIIAGANWLNDFDDFGWLADPLAKTELPIFMVGIGAQSADSNSIPKLKSGTLKLMKIISERSASISTRGGFSSEVLASYGIKNSHVTGCPSLLMRGAAPPAIGGIARITPTSCAIHSTRHLYAPAKGIHAYLYRQAIEQNIPIVLQSELSDLYYTFGRTQNVEIMQKVNPVVVESYGCLIDTVASYLREKSSIFFELNHWIQYLSRRQFCFGTRLHGCVASLIAGTPATLITHDTRTLEAAQIMGIPFIEDHKINIDDKLDVSALYSPVLMRKFDLSYRNYYQNFLGFFAVNGIQVN
jgi:hypothetical protein